MQQKELFRKGFVQALKEGDKQGLFFVGRVDAGEEKPDWAQVIEIGVIKRIGDVVPPPPTPPQVWDYTLRAKVPWDKLFDFMRGVVTPLYKESDELVLGVSLKATSKPGGFTKTTLDNKVRETLNQIGAQVEQDTVQPKYQ